MQPKSNITVVRKFGGVLKYMNYKSIDTLIDEIGLKKDAVASKMGISRQRLYEFRKNPTLMNIEQMEKLAFILNVSFFDIYNIRKNFKEKVDKNTTILTN